MKKKKLIITLSIVLAVILALGGIAAALFPSSWMFSEKTHIARVSRRVERRYMRNNGKYDYTGYTVYPLYNENGELAFFLVEFEPYGYIYIKLYDMDVSCIGGAAMYMRNVYGDKPSHQQWQRRSVGDWNYYEGKQEWIYETDENGEYIYYNNSHFKVAGIENERRYVIYWSGSDDGGHSWGGYIPAVKRGDKYLNLASMQEFDPTDDDTPLQPMMGALFVPKAGFKL